MADYIAALIDAANYRDLTREEVQALGAEIIRLRRAEHTAKFLSPRPKVDPFHKVIAFRGAKTGEIPVIPQEAVEAGIQMHVERRSQLIRNALIEEGADPDHVDAINNPARKAEAHLIPPIPDDILDRVRRRVADGEFDEPFTIPLPQEGP